MLVWTWPASNSSNSPRVISHRCFLINSYSNSNQALHLSMANHQFCRINCIWLRTLQSTITSKWFRLIPNNSSLEFCLYLLIHNPSCRSNPAKFHNSSNSSRHSLNNQWSNNLHHLNSNKLPSCLAASNNNRLKTKCNPKLRRKTYKIIFIHFWDN